MATLASLTALVQQLQQELQNQRVELQNQRVEIHSLRADIQRLQAQPAPPPRSHLPDPPRFDGKPYTLRTWLPSIRAKLRSSQLSGADAFDYVWDRLEQPQQASVLHLRHLAETNQSWDPEILFSFFQRLCYNPREHQEAVQRLTIIRQRDDESLVAYLARFERLVYEAEASSWPDVTRVTTIHRGLRPSLRQPLEESNDSLFSLSYNSYIELVQLHDRRLRRPQYQPPQKPVRNPDPPDTDPMQINALEITVPTSPTLSRRSSSHSSSDRYEHRSENGLCYYCGSNSHWIADCPRSSSSSPGIARPRTKMTAKSLQHPSLRYAASSS